MKQLIKILMLICIPFVYQQRLDAQTYSDASFDLGLLYNSAKTQKNQKPKKQYPAPFIGISAGMGGSFGPYYRSLDGALSFEAAGSCNKEFALGAYLKYQSVASLSTGMIFIHGNHNEGAAFMWGMGFLGGLPRNIYNYPYLQSESMDITINRKMYYNFGGELRLGCKFKSSWYMWLDVSARAVDVKTNYNSYQTPFDDFNHDHEGSWHDSYIIATSISVGYKFKIKQQSKVEAEGTL